jgi:hypothetical protein
MGARIEFGNSGDIAKQDIALACQVGLLQSLPSLKASSDQVKAFVKEAINLRE